MVKRIGTARRKTRHLLKKGFRERGKISLKKFFQEFKVGQKVILKAEPGYQKGLYHPRFHGRHGIVKGKQGNAYLVEVKDIKKTKTVLVHPVHLKNGNN